MKKHIFVAGTALAAAALTAFSLTPAFAAPASGWEAPSSSKSTDDGVVTVGAHGAAIVESEILGLNGTSIGNTSIKTSTAAEAAQSDLLGIFGSSMNTASNPYLQNLFYGRATGTSVAGSSAVYTGSSVGEANFNANVEALYGTTADLAQRPDVVVGLAGSPGTTSSGSFNRSTTTAVNYQSWGSATTGLPSQGYSYVTQLRAGVSSAAQLGSLNSDGNACWLNANYKAGDESYDPVGVSYAGYTTAVGQQSSSSSTSTQAYIADMNELVRGAETVMEQKGGTGRYGDPEAIATKFEQYALGSKWYVLSKIADGTVKKRTVAVVVNTDANAGTVTLARLNPDGDTARLGTLRAGEAAQDTTDDLAASVDPSAAAGSINVKASAKDLLKADVVICAPGISDSYKCSKADVEAALKAAGVDESAMPRIMDSDLPTGVMGSVNGFNRSVDSVMLNGVIQGFIYPELFSSVDMTTYFASVLYHVKDASLKSVVADQLEGTTLASGVSIDGSSFDAATVKKVQALLDAGTTYYYANKAAIDKQRPLLASTDNFDYNNDYNTAAITISAPQGATVSVTVPSGEEATRDASGAYVIPKDKTSTLKIELDGYATYTRQISAADGNITVGVDDMVLLKTLKLSVPEGATVVIKDCNGSVVRPDADGAYTYSARGAASLKLTLEGYVTYKCEISVETTDLAITEDMLQAVTATTISVPAGAVVSVTAADGTEAETNDDYDYLLVNGASYTVTVRLTGYKDYVLSVTGGEQESIKVLKVDMTPEGGKKSVTINSATVTAARVKAAVDSSTTTVVLGAKVKGISAKALAGTTVKTVVIKSAKLKAGKVKNCFKGSAVKTVQVPKGKLKAYKKIFTAKICGKSVKVK